LKKNSVDVDDSGDVETQEDDDEGGDVVLYQLPHNQAGPPFHAPGLQASQSTKSLHLSSAGGGAVLSKTLEFDGQQDKSVSMQPFDFEQLHAGIASAPNLLSTISVMPPPGFGSLSTQIGQTPLEGRTINASSTPDQSSLANESILRRIIQGQTGTEGPSRFLCALDSQIDNGLWNDPSGHLKLPGDQGVRIAASPHLFGGDVYTANPFAPNLQLHTNPAPSNIVVGISENGHHHLEETTLLSLQSE
jgi:hypothetical protein